jgi:hypothetical protein
MTDAHTDDQTTTSTDQLERIADALEGILAALQPSTKSRPLPPRRIR